MLVAVAHLVPLGNRHLVGVTNVSAVAVTGIVLVTGIETAPGPAHVPETEIGNVGQTATGTYRHCSIQIS